MTYYTAERLSDAIAAICPDIESNVRNASKKPDDRIMWWELSSCILSSQVPYSLAITAADVIDRSALLYGDDLKGINLFEELNRLLEQPLVVEGKARHYRFPRIRAQQLAAARQAIILQSGSILELVQGFKDPVVAREWLVKKIPGVGPKQASMFLRNIGFSYDLAIIDRHVLNYMSIIGISSDGLKSISGMKEYGKRESSLRDYAEQLDCTVGILDWAIWIVMRVASGRMEKNFV